MRCTGMLKTFAAAVGLAAGLAPAQSAPFMIVGNDEKLLWDDQFKPVLSPPGRDSVLIVDLADPMNPRIVANLALKNSVIGPPVNLDIDPTGTLALVADSVDVIRDGASLKQVPDDKVHVIDLKADPPKAIGMVTVGKQPSGLSINPAGTLALVANREDKSISVLSINGTAVKLIDTVAMGDSVSHATFTPDGKRALATKFPAHQVSLLDVDGDKVTYRKLDLPTGLWPFNVAVAPGGRIALTADSGNAAGSDGSVDTVSVVDLEAQPPRIIDRVVVGDGPEGSPSARTATWRSPSFWPAPTTSRPISIIATVRSRCCASTARRSRRSGTSKSADCRRRWRSRRTAAGSWSAIISIRTFPSCGSTGPRSRTPASASGCRAIQPPRAWGRASARQEKVLRLPGPPI